MSCKSKTLFIFIFFLLFVQISIAQEKGKIFGVVVDAETNEPLPGANIFIEGTSIGTATDAKGEYFLINLQPNVYSITASFIGYQKVTIKNVIINSGRTTNINFQLSNKTISSEEVVVIAKKPVIQKDISNSQDVAFGEDIITMPTVTNITGFVGRQAGVEGSSIRGGSIDETSYAIDGAVMVDPTSNVPYTGIPLAAIQEVTVIKGGFNAEYGNIRSGLISITTKDGDKDKYNFSVDMKVTLPNRKHFGPSMFSPNNYFLRPYFHPKVTWDGTENWERWEFLQSPGNFQGWKKWAEQYNQSNPDNNLTPEEARELFMWTHTVEAKEEWGVVGAEALGQRPRTYGDKPDLNGEVSFSGPIPFIGKYLGNLTFFGSYKVNNTYLTVPFSRDNIFQQDGQLKLTSNPASGMKIYLQGFLSKLEGVNQFWGNGVDGSYMTVNRSIYKANQRNTYYYWESAFSPLDINKTMGTLAFDYVPNQSSFYNVKFTIANTKYISQGYLNERDTTIQKYFGSGPERLGVDEIPWGWTSYAFQQDVDQPDRRRLGGDGGMIWDLSQGTTYNLRFDYFTQLNTYNAIKTGFELFYSDIDVDRQKIKARSKKDVNSTNFVKPADWFSREYQAFPLRSSFYAQDKIEVEGMVANLGVRFDYFNTNTTNYFVDPYSKYYDGQYAEVFLDSIPQAKTEGILKISPRIGIAFPISSVAKLFFNYGHFYAYPRSDDLYGLIREDKQKITKVGNPAADLPKTISYEIGVEVNISDMFLLHMTGYYKDVSNQLTSVRFVGTNSVSYKTILNQNIEDIRGFELRFEKNKGDWFKGWINFSFLSTFRGDIGRNIYYEEEERNIRSGILDFDATYRKPNARPFVRGNLDFFTSKDFMDNGLLSDWHLGLFPAWKAGAFYTFSPGGKDKPEFANNIQWPDYWNLDLRLTKYVEILDALWSFYLEVNNVFNFKTFSGSVNYGFSDAIDRENYLSSLRLPLYSGESYQEAGLTAGNDKVGELRSKEKPYIDDPNLTHSLWGTPRSIVFGIRVGF